MELAKTTQDLPHKYAQIRHLWPNIARDLVMMNESSADPVHPTTIAATYKLTPLELSELISLPAFKAVFYVEAQKAKDLGPKAAFQLRAQAIFADLTETVYCRLKEPKVDSSVLLSGYKFMAEVAGLIDKDKGGGKAGNTNGPAVAIQINLPSSDNPKFDHLKVVEHVV